MRQLKSRGKHGLKLYRRRPTASSPADVYGCTSQISPPALDRVCSAAILLQTILCSVILHCDALIQVLSRANLDAAAATQVKGNVENVLEQKSRVSYGVRL